MTGDLVVGSAGEGMRVVPAEALGVPIPDPAVYDQASIHRAMPDLAPFR